MIRRVFFSLCLLWTISAHAEVTLSDGNIAIQHVAKPELYVFCSKKQTRIMLDRVKFARSASAGWSNELAPFTCTIFFTDNSPFIFSCQQELSGVWTPVDCHQYVLASRFPWEGALLAGDTLRGSYWVAQNIASDDIPMVLRHRGFDV